MTLGDVLPAQIKRVQGIKERYIEFATEVERLTPGAAIGLKISTQIMQAQIDEGVAALASGDVVRMIAAHQALADYSDED